MSKATKNAAKTNSKSIKSAKNNLRKAVAKLVKEAPKAVKTTKAVKVVKATTADKERKFGRDKETIAALKKEGSKNPYREGSSYHACCQVLANHFGKMIDLKTIVAEYAKVLGTESFKAFKSKEARNDNGKDYVGRITQNLDVIRRESDYGMPIVQLGLEVRRDKSEDGIKYGIFKR